MTRTGLSEEEERQLLLLLEGDVSDLDLEESDDDAEFEIEDVQDCPTSNIIRNGLNYEKSNGEEYDSDDDIPLAVRFGIQTSNNASHASTSKKEKKKEHRWQKRDLDEVASVCEIHFSDPPDPELTPMAYFKYLFDDSIIENIANQTNLYSVEKNGSSINTSSREIQQFLGIHILSSIVKMPSYRMYWAESTRYLPIADIMSRNRFDKLRNYVHLNDNSNMKPRDDTEYDKLFKIRPVIDAVLSNFAAIELEEHISVDEIIIPFKGRSSLKQYIKNKPHKWGIKLFARAGISGIIYDFEVYIGKGTVKNASTLGISGDIVMRLVDNVPKNNNYKLYCDNWFTSVELFHKLRSLGILATGTVRSNRIPGCIMKADNILKKSGRGSFDYHTNQDNIIAVKWFDNKPVHLLSTYKGIQPVEPIERWSVAEKGYIQVPRPDIIKEYNTNMGGVDLHDMLVSLYRINIGVRRFYLRIFWNIVDMCIVNSWLLYRRHMSQMGKKYKTLVVFRSEIAQGLMNAGKTEPRKRGRPLSDKCNTPSPPVKRNVTAVPIDDVRYDAVDHWPVHISTKQRCRFCIYAYCRIMCEKCKMPLCLTKDKNCFKLFHCK